MDYPTNIEPPRKTYDLYKPYSEVLPNHPFTWLIVAPRKSGKSVLLNNIVGRLLRDHSKKRKRGKEPKPFFDLVIMSSPTASQDPSIDTKHVSMLLPKYEDSQIKGIITMAEKMRMENQNGKYARILWVIDDCLGQNKSSGLSRWSHLESFALRNRHYGVSLLITSQVLRALSPGFRENGSAWCIFKLPSDLELKKMEEEISGFLRAYDQAVVKGPPYSFVYIKVEGGQIHFFHKFEKLLFVK